MVKNMTDKNKELPPLPEPAGSIEVDCGPAGLGYMEGARKVSAEDGYSADQMLAYGEACRASQAADAVPVTSISDDAGFPEVLGQYVQDAYNGKGIAATLPLTRYIDKWHAATPSPTTAPASDAEAIPPQWQSDRRAAFEAWAKSEFAEEYEDCGENTFNRMSSGKYESMLIRNAWTAFDAGTQAAPSGLCAHETWVAISDRVPAVGQSVLIFFPQDPAEPYRIDMWDEQHEDPIGMGGPTICTGVGWNVFYDEEITYWMPLPAVDSLASMSAGASGATQGEKA